MRRKKLQHSIKRDDSSTQNIIDATRIPDVWLFRFWSILKLPLRPLLRIYGVREILDDLLVALTFTAIFGFCEIPGSRNHNSPEKCANEILISRIFMRKTTYPRREDGSGKEKVIPAINFPGFPTL